MTRHSIVKAFKSPVASNAPNSILLKSGKPFLALKQKQKVLPKKYITKLDASNIQQLKIYRKQGLLTNKRAMLHRISLHKTGLFEVFADLLEYLFNNNDVDQVYHHRLLFRKLAQKIQSRALLPSLSLKMIRSDDYSEDFLQAVQRSLATAKHLKSLNLTWHLAEPTNNTCMPLFTKIIHFIRRITSLNIDFRNSDLNDENLIRFSYSLLKLNRLKSLNLNLSSVNIQNNNGGTNPLMYLAIALRKLSQLEELDLDLSKNNFATSDFLIQLSYALFQLKGLKRVNISLAGTLIQSPLCLGYLAQSLQNTASLESLSLNLNRCFQEISDIQDFTFALTNLSQLKSLHLYCDSWFESNDDQNMQRLCQALQQLHNLSELVLTLNGWGAVESPTLKYFADTISHLQSLRILALDLSHFGQRLKSSEEISFVEKNSMADETLAYLGTKLMSLRRLRELALYISGIKGVTKMGIEGLAISLTQMKTLRTLIMTAEDYDELNEKDLCEILSHFNSFVTLKTAQISFQGCKLTLKNCRELYNLLKGLENKIQMEIYPSVKFLREEIRNYQRRHKSYPVKKQSSSKLNKMEMV